MSDHHLDETAWQLLLHADGRQPRRLARDLLHLVLCEECQEQAPARTILARVFGDNLPLDLVELRRAQMTETRFWRAVAHAEKHMADAVAEMEAASELWQELQSHPWQRRSWLVLNSPRFQQCGLVLHLLKVSRECWNHDVKEAERRARLALSCLRRISHENYPAGLLADYEARALAYIANCLRLLGELHEAERLFEAARLTLKEGSGALDEAACLDLLEAGLRREQRRFKKAIALNRKAAKLYRRLGDHHSYLVARTSEACILGESGQTEKAISTLSSLLERHADSLPPDLYLAVSQGLSHRQLEAGALTKALAQLPNSRMLASHVGCAINEIRIDWLEGQIWAAQGKRDDAQARLHEVQQAFQEKGMAYDAALAALDRAVVLLEDGRLAEARELAAELLPVFRSREIHREATGALLVFAEAARKEAATAGLAREVAEFLKQARHNLELTFEPHLVGEGEGET